MNLLRFSTLSALLLILVVSGCDNASTDPFDDANIDANEDAAVAIANAVALESGGALDAAADAVEVAAADAAKSGAGCEYERSYDEGTQTWTGFVSCEFGSPERLFYSLFSRTRTYQFLDESGSPQQYPENAQALNFAIVDGEGIRQRPGFSHELLDLGADLVVEGLGEELKTVNGTYDRSATDTLYTRNVERTLTYDLALTFIDVQGAGRVRDGNRPVSGTIEGVYEALHTFSAPDGTREQTVTREFTITFGGGDDRDITIDIGGDTFLADLMTGEVEGLD
ncbi:MAG: hypothetical protein HKN04_09030 [Rhodothermaceae bacterium]|nr:hypothetical protein [Rhodothermaceae bacterium]